MGSKVDRLALSSVNKREIINLIREKSPIYRAEIARSCGLSLPTVMKITDGFIERGLVREIGQAKSTGGKPPTLLEFIGTAKYIVGVDVGTTNIIVILMDLTANIVYKAQQKTDHAHRVEIVAEQIVNLIREVISRSGVPEDKLLGIGVGVPGLVQPDTGIITFSPDLGWKHVDMRETLNQHFNLPVMIDNVTRAMAMGELNFGLGKNLCNFMCINLGYGIGASIVIDGQLYKGSKGTSGEFGHIAVEKDGPLCDCGNHGCLEALASANAMSKQARAAIQSGAQSLLLSLANGNAEDIDAKLIYEAYKANDSLATAIVMQSITYLGVAIGSMINFLDPQMIILEGGVSKAGDTLLTPLRAEVKKHVISGHEPHFAISALGGNAAAVGAASYLLENFIRHGCEEEYIMTQ